MCRRGTTWAANRGGRLVVKSQRPGLIASSDSRVLFWAFHFFDFFESLPKTTTTKSNKLLAESPTIDISIASPFEYSCLSKRIPESNTKFSTSAYAKKNTKCIRRKPPTPRGLNRVTTKATDTIESTSDATGIRSMSQSIAVLFSIFPVLLLSGRIPSMVKSCAHSLA